MKYFKRDMLIKKIFCVKYVYWLLFLLPKMMIYSWISSNIYWFIYKHYFIWRKIDLVMFELTKTKIFKQFLFLIILNYIFSFWLEFSNFPSLNRCTSFLFFFYDLIFLTFLPPILLPISLSFLNIPSSHPTSNLHFFLNLFVLPATICGHHFPMPPVPQAWNKT